MKQFFKRGTAFILAAVMTFGLVCGLRADAFAYPTDHVNTYVNTGNQRNDIVGVAKTQVGYKEGSDGGTKYGAWWMEYNGLGASAISLQWCSLFVLWCANQANAAWQAAPQCFLNISQAPMAVRHMHSAAVTFPAQAILFL